MHLLGCSETGSRRLEAEMLAKDPNYRGLGYWIEQVKAEHEAEIAA